MLNSYISYEYIYTNARTRGRDSGRRYETYTMKDNTPKFVGGADPRDRIIARPGLVVASRCFIATRAQWTCRWTATIKKKKGHHIFTDEDSQRIYFFQWRGMWRHRSASTPSLYDRLLGNNSMNLLLKGIPVLYVIKNPLHIRHEHAWGRYNCWPRRPTSIEVKDQ